jgi:integrase
VGYDIVERLAVDAGHRTIGQLGAGAVFAPDGALACRCRAGGQARLRVLRRQHPQPEHAQGLRAGGGRLRDLVRGHGIADVRQVQPVHVAAYIEGLQIAAPSVKQRLAALRMLFDWLVIGQVMPTNPASSVRGPRHSVKKGKTPVLAAEEARALLDAIDTSTVIGLRDRALIGLMVYTFARVGAAIKMRVEDVYVQGRRTWVRLHEKGGKQHEMPCHHNLEAWLHEYIEGAQLVDAKGYLFRTAAGRTGQLSDNAHGPGRRLSDGRPTRRGRRHPHEHRLPQLPRHRHHRVPAQRRQAGDRAADGQPRPGSTTGGPTRRRNRESARTTGLYDRRTDQVNLDEVERIQI